MRPGGEHAGREGRARLRREQQGGVATHLALDGGEIRERAIGGEDGVDPTQPLDAELMLADRRLLGA
jgi:hypothetical protein